MEIEILDQRALLIRQRDDAIAARDIAARRAEHWERLAVTMAQVRDRFEAALLSIVALPHVDPPCARCIAVAALGIADIPQGWKPKEQP